MGLTLAEIVAGLIAAKASLQASADAAIAALEAISPDSLKGAEEEIRAKLDDALSQINITIAALQGGLSSAQTVVLAGKGPVAGGPDATIA